ncbi:MAG TPA: hypothetical protein VGF86_04190 [Candidatus Tumulicola sp.]|jgi:uncharacterized membrane protein
MIRQFAGRATPWIVLANLALVVPLAWILNVWQDEAYSLLTTTGSLAHTVHQAIFFEQNAPLYFVVLWFWRHVSTGYFWARILSIGCIATTIGLVPALIRRYAPGIPAAAVTLTVAFNPLTVWAAVEIRSYAMAIALGALAMLAGYDAFFAPASRRYALLAFVAIGAAAAYTQYFILFLIAGFGIVLAAKRSWKPLARYVLAGVAMLVLFVPELVILPAQLSAFRTAYLGPASLGQALEQLAKILFFQLFQIGELPHRAVFAAAIAAALIVGLVLGRKHFAGRGPRLAIALLAASAVVYATAVYVLKTHLDYRYGAFLFIPLILATFSLLGWWDGAARRRGAIALATLLLCVSAVVLVHTYRSGAKIGDWRRVGAFLDANASASQPIVVFQAENAVPLAYYYRGPGRIVAIPHPVDFRSYDVARFVIHRSSEVNAAIVRLGNPRELWLVTAGACHSLNVRYGCGLVNAYFDAHYATVERRDFYHASVRLLRRN